MKSHDDAKENFVDKFDLSSIKLINQLGVHQKK